MSSSKLLFVYDHADTDIGLEDFFIASTTLPHYTGPGFGPRAVGGPEGQGTIAAIPEPSAFAMLGFGLLALWLAAWRRRV